MKLHVALVDDERLYTNQIQDYLQRYQREKQVEIKVSVYSDGVDIVENYSADYDAIFLDIQMKHLDGITTAKRIRSMDQEVILMFITNMTQYAIQGYQVDALDYIVKPIEYFAFAQKLDKIFGRLKKKQQHFVTIPVEDGVRKLDIASVYYIESQGHTLIYQTEEGEFESRGVLKDTEAALEPYGFFRCDKGILVNINHVKGIKEGYCEVHGKQLTISRRRRKAFMEQLLKGMDEVIG